MSDTAKTLKINGIEVSFTDERNVLEVARKAGIDIPTFCYHSDLSIYGACRLCLVDIKGLGIAASCSTTPTAGMEIKTHTEELRTMRRVALELMLANHDQDCNTCPKNTRCKLQTLARQHGIQEVRFKRTLVKRPIDRSSLSLVRDPNKCILCGDCVRACNEIQGVGAIGFANRGAKSIVEPPFGKPLADVECVNCGLCATVCPVGALTVRDDVEDVWKVVNDPSKTVVVEIAPAVRVAIGEAFGGEPGAIEVGRIVTALKLIGFDKVFDTSFSADQTIFEEATEFINRKTKGGVLPQFTSCCPAWVKYAEHFLPDMLPNLSTARSPMGMFGATAKMILPELLGIEKKDLVTVAIMPCTAKKFETKLPKFNDPHDGVAPNDFTLTVQELIRMIQEAGVRFEELQPEPLDPPFNVKTGGGVIFGTTGGVMEAALRYAVEKIQGTPLTDFEFKGVRGEKQIKEAEFDVKGIKVSVCVLYGLANARKVVDWVRSGEKHYDFIEVMACPHGCVGGAGQPVTNDWAVRRKRSDGLYKADKMLQLHKSQENQALQDCYDKYFEGGVGGHTAHELLHTTYQNRQRIHGLTMPILDDTGSKAEVKVSVCVGTSCYRRGAQSVLKKIEDYIQGEGLGHLVKLEAAFCTENCTKGPSVIVGAREIFHATAELVIDEIKKQLVKVKI
ncbi:MAG: [FeFe] hydrogenase, group A [Planctomycetaceae bacterium]|jgi:NADH-quinone oxidoreductase subunit G|nr:[FeFe] hydrogenase, group A [Planctomycetaceae bacterium]